MGTRRRCERLALFVVAIFVLCFVSRTVLEIAESMFEQLASLRDSILPLHKKYSEKGLMKDAIAKWRQLNDEIPKRINALKIKRAKEREEKKEKEEGKKEPEETKQEEKEDDEGQQEEMDAEKARKVLENLRNKHADQLDQIEDEELYE